MEKFIVLSNKNIYGGVQGLSHGILLGPAPSRRLILDLVGLAHMGYFRNKRIIRVWICKQ